MPILEYLCKGCDRQFEVIVYGSQQPSCPHCHGTELEKQLSVFAVGTQGLRMSPAEAGSPCSTCGDPRGPGSCPMYRP